jgi:hypothetical protein
MRRFPSLLPALISTSFYISLFATSGVAAPQFLDDEAEPACDVSFGLQKGATGQFSLLFDVQNAKNGYVLDANSTGAAFSLLENGQKRVLARAPVKWKAQNSVTLQRRLWSMRLLVNGRVALTAFDATWNKGKIGAEMTGWTWKEARVQPVEAIRFDDDFTRAGREGDDSWSVADGKWALTASSTQINARNATMSSNPFAYEVSARTGNALATTGRRFWDSTTHESQHVRWAKARWASPLMCRIRKITSLSCGVGTQSAQARRLIRVQNGKTTILASAAAHFCRASGMKSGCALRLDISKRFSMVCRFCAPETILRAGRHWPSGAKPRRGLI